MICYKPFWETLTRTGITGYALVHKYNISNGTLYRMRKNEPLSTVTINELCKILKCRVEDILLYVEEE